MKYLIALAALLLLVALGFMFRPDEARMPVLGTHYENTTYGITFTYPPGFVVTEQEVGTADRGHYIIAVMRKEDTTPPVGGEGAAAVTLNIYQNDSNQMSISDWMRGTNESNFKLGPGDYATTTTGGVESVTYRWSGLYEGETTALLHENAIVAIAVNYLSPEDTTIDAYQMVIGTLTLR